MIAITPQCMLDDAELSFSFVRSGGPGGQNVNKVSTAAQLRFDVLHSPSLSPDCKQRLIVLAGSRMTLNGEIVIHANRFRTQEGNRADAVDRLIALIRKAMTLRKKRKKSKPTFSSIRRRIETKKEHGEKKRNRRFSGFE
jgi:ribosome-associated protein